ncbi:unnamed protein product [Bursaphelenchus xylophilus]|uniref:(pine wood nematode) hypothetical protein n=1 Tax=Bursaphelenchus xylophilus TaxID=6326 RepID=A0A811JYU6_BURXY|nr:unnamed protein product [Bursaphelenchus xylophilus]CAG9080816.1 unnamed protein product [Bursaphelenchus xylophilus]
MAHLFKPYHVNLYLIPFALAFSTDRIAEVRKGGVRMLAEVLALLIRHEHAACKISGLPIDAPNAMPLSDAFLKDVRTGFWKSLNWRKRQSFAQMLEILARERLLTPKTFCQTFKQPLLELSMDQIHNVRQYFCTVVESLGRERIEAADPELNSVIIGRLHDMAARDEDLEIRTQSRAVLGTVDPKKQELDLSQRDNYLAAAEEKDRQLREEDDFVAEKSPKSPRTYAVNENPEVHSHLTDLPKKFAEIQKKTEASKSQLTSPLSSLASTSVLNNQFAWIPPRLRRNGVSVEEDEKILTGRFKEEEEDNDDDDLPDDFNTTINDVDDLDFQSHDLEYDEPDNDFMKKHPSLIVAKVAPQPIEPEEVKNNESTV